MKELNEEDNNWKISFDSKSCPYREQDQDATFCIHGLQDESNTPFCSANQCPLIEMPEAMQIAAENIVKNKMLGYESLNEFIRESIRMNLLRFY